METNPDSNQKVLKAIEVSRFLRMPLSTVYNLTVKGKIPAVKFGRQWRFLEKDITNYMNGIPSKANHSGIDVNEKRQSPRIKTEIQAVLLGGLTLTQEIRKDGMIFNLSEGGAFFVPHDSGLEIGDPVRIVFTLPANGHIGEIETEGRIIHQARNSKKGFGIKFRQLTQRIQEGIKNYVG